MASPRGPSGGGGGDRQLHEPPELWGADVGRVAVDPTNLRAVCREKPEVRKIIPSSCDRYAAACIAQALRGCTLFIVLPALGLALGHKLTRALAFDAGDVVYDTVVGVSALIIAIGSLVCLRCLCVVLCAALRPPKAAPCVPPLCAKHLNPTHKHAPTRRVAVLYNPKAGKCRGERILADLVLPTLQEGGVEVAERLPTQHFGHAREMGLSHDFSNVDAIIVMGGDGTLHELANGLLSRGPSSALPPLAMVPLGSGNALVTDYRQNLRFRGKEMAANDELEAIVPWAVKRAVGGHSACIDTLAVTWQGRQLSSVGLVFFGLVADVDFLSEPLRCLGPLRFDIAALWRLQTRTPMAPCRVEITLPDGSRRELAGGVGGEPRWLSVFVQTGQHLSGTQRSSPNAILDDGIAELAIVKEAPRTTLLQTMMLLETGAHMNHPALSGAFETIPFVEVTLTFGEGETPEVGLFNVDGQNFSHEGVVNIRMQTQSLRLFCSPDEDTGEAKASNPSDAVPATVSLIEPLADTEEAVVYGSRWVMLAIFCFQSMINQVVWITFSPIANVVLLTFHPPGGNFFVNVLSLSFMVTYLPMTFPASALIERAGCRQGVLLGGVLTAVGATVRCIAVFDGCPHTLQWTSLLAGQVLAAMGQPFLTNLPPKLAHTWFPVHQWALADTIATVAATLGAAVGMVLPTSMPGHSVGDGSRGISETLVVEACLCVLALVLCTACFRKAPPTPPFVEEHEEESGRGSIVAVSMEAMRDKSFLMLWLAFSFGLGTFNTVSTLLQQLIGPFGFTDEDASNFGALTVAFGIVGAGVASVILDKTCAYRSVLRVCFVLAAASMVCLAITVPFGPDVIALPMISVAGLGLTLTPVMPAAFEASTALLSHKFGETVLSGLLMMGGQVVGIVMTLTITALQSQNATLCLWLSAVGIVAGAVVVFLGNIDQEEILRRRRVQAGPSASRITGTASLGASLRGSLIPR